MLTYLRYALAAVCFAASAGCLALWWRGVYHSEVFLGPSFSHSRRVAYFGNAHGSSSVGLMPEAQAWPNVAWSHIELPLTDEDREFRDIMSQQFGRFRFSAEYDELAFPVWYPALIFAFAGVGVLRFRRQFSIRSALICVSVVAALLGMAVAL